MNKFLNIFAVAVLSLSLLSLSHGQSAASHLPWNVFTLSQVGGITLDCVLSTGLTASGGACTDNTIAINAILAKASATFPVKVIIDGGTIEYGGIVGPASGNWSIQGTGWGSGFYCGVGSNSHIIRNIPSPTGYTWAQAPPTPGNYVELRDFQINGNQGNGSNGCVTSSGDPRFVPGGTIVMAVTLESVNHVVIDHVYVYHSPSYCIHINSGSDIIVKDSRCEDVFGQAYSVNGDGVHIDGPSSQVKITNIDCLANDDCVALNAAEGFGGTIRDAYVAGVQCHPCLSFMRTLSNENQLPGYPASAANAAVQNVVFDGGTGTISDSAASAIAAFPLGYTHAASSTIDIMQSIKISNVTATITSATANMVSVADDIGELALNNLTWLSPAGAVPFLGFNQAAVISSYSSVQCQINRNTGGSAAAYWAQVPTGATIKRFSAVDSAVVNEQGQSYSAISYAIDLPSGGAITNLIPGFDPTLVSAILNGNQWSRVANTLGVLTNCGTTSTCSTSNVIYNGGYGKTVIASAPLVSGTPSAVTISGFPVPFASTTSFRCTTSNSTSAINNLLQVVNTSTSSGTVTGPNAVTDTVSVVCTGN